ncbi:SRPBCC family protein [Acinetobacter gerneri]|uniref:SRPBCC family protein n=1 Tax=Acinetobacter gerneri TaxID=202952 RepID=A0AAW8JGU5_9GAMM|nr:SRPBCC family protein [Acinetobacter gerneri]MDQ9008239.1 SRPBCC family protein [Acinetobacter gerneri]MDQ9012347.1 SRPBCC family protein [Acinetobacter gerneri]MDQ9023778.1 SRPBCC family protein [Acinetobacter gerneri]MDQ9051260.1 SRPBCC family protein [Acinetobacter gerneri]MDQ9058881.1 SRPBCC family protein [Acinetobacter gerneri]
MPVIETQMLIRKPVQEVFNAFIDPKLSSKFWFSHSTGKLEQGKTVQWTWEKYQHQAEVVVLAVEQNKLIKILWGSPRTAVDFIFEEIAPAQTYVKIRNFDLPFQGSELIAYIIDSTGGFTTVLDNLKAYLEHGIELNLVKDKFPPFK